MLPINIKYNNKQNTNKKNETDIIIKDYKGLFTEGNYNFNCSEIGHIQKKTSIKTVLKM